MHDASRAAAKVLPPKLPTVIGCDIFKLAASGECVGVKQFYRPTGNYAMHAVLPDHIDRRDTPRDEVFSVDRFEGGK